MRIRQSATIVALILALAGIVSAQVSNTGTITVTVSDKDGGRLPGVTVTAAAPDTITKRTVVTDAEGVATLEALAPSNAVLSWSSNCLASRTPSAGRSSCARARRRRSPSRCRSPASPRRCR